MTRLLTALIVLALAGTATAADKTPSTHLLFTHVTNQAGFDTAIIISNTSLDPFGTTPEDGKCTISFFGINPPAPVTTGTMAAGTVFTTLASSVAPGFNGYAFADCQFDHAHGQTFVSDLGARNLAYGEQAHVLPAKKKRPVKSEHLGY